MEFDQAAADPGREHCAYCSNTGPARDGDPDDWLDHCPICGRPPGEALADDETDLRLIARFRDRDGLAVAEDIVMVVPAHTGSVYLAPIGLDLRIDLSITRASS